MQPLSKVWNLQEATVKPFAQFSTETFMVWHLREAAAKPLLMVRNLQEIGVKQFTHFYNEILMVLEASGGCCESMIDGLESPGGCCEAIYTLLQRNINGFGSFMRIL